MTGAMYAAVAGLKTHMQNLNVIGNNIANINTAGYKAGRSVFQSALYTQIRGGSDGTTTAGARNPSPLGYGVSVGTVDIDMSTGSYNPTGKSTDCMLDGDGFFLVGDKAAARNIDPSKPSTFTTLTLTRVGDFEFKSDGYLSNYDGDVVYGFMCIGVDAAGKPVFSDQLVPIRYPKAEKAYEDKDGKPLIEGTDDKGNRGFFHVDENGDPTGDAVDPKDVIATTKVHYPTAYMKGEGDDAVPSLGPSYEAEADRDTVKAVALQDYDDEMPFALMDTISYDEKSGIISGTVKGTSEVITIGMLAVGNVTNPNGVTQISGTKYKAGTGSGDLSITTIYNVGADNGIEYVNGSLYEQQQKDAGVTDVPALGELARVTSAGTTMVRGSGLEQSKTDLATEIANMITTQRGYQANTRIITVTDSMLEELVNMKR